MSKIAPMVYDNSSAIHKAKLVFKGQPRKTDIFVDDMKMTELIEIKLSIHDGELIFVEGEGKAWHTQDGQLVCNQIKFKLIELQGELECTIV